MLELKGIGDANMRKARTVVTPGTVASYHGIIVDMTARQSTAGMQVIEDYENNANSDLKNS